MSFDKKLFNDQWLFHCFPLETDYKTASLCEDLSRIDVPHDWLIYDTNNLYKDGLGYYKKTFLCNPLPIHSYFVRFEGVYMDSTVYLNGHKIKEWKYGYSTFDADLSEHIKNGENVLEVLVRYQSPNTRWYSGAGIYRDVWFIEKDSAYLAMDGIYLSTAKENENFTVTVSTELFSQLSTAATLSHKVLDKEGNLVAQALSDVTLSLGLTVNECSFTVEKPILWDLTNPYLYKVETSLYIDNRLTDSEVNPLGFRTIRFDCNKGFFLNDKNIKINGVCQHHDLGCLGSAFHKSALRRQFEKLKAMGVNSIRTSHNMPAKDFMNLADEMGLLINSEAFDMWELPKTEYDYARFFPSWCKTDVKSWVRRDRNHPSLIIWSIGNEIYDTHSGNGQKWTKILRDEVRVHDDRHNAYIGIGSNFIEWEPAQKCSDMLELSGYNYGERLYDAHHEKYKNWCIFGSETASTVQSRGIYHFPLEARIMTHEDGQCSCLGNCSTNWGAPDVDHVVSMHRDRDFVFGQYLWTGWDYIGEPTPFFSKNSYFGQIDTAGFEKDTYYHYQAEWTDVSKNPMIHLLPYWDFNEGQIIDVIAYSNASLVELFVNGKSQGQRTIDHLHATDLKAHWKVPYTQGECKAVAYDSYGNIIATDIMRSFSDPASLVMSSEKETVYADGRDLLFIDISCVDSDNTFVANARNRVTVNVEGEGVLMGLDNGDSTDYEQYKCTNRKLFSGKLLAVVKATKKPGEIKITASSNGLKSASLCIESLPAKLTEGVSQTETIPDSTADFDIPIRKIRLFDLGSSHLDKENPSTYVSLETLPQNATYSDVSVRALTKEGVDASFVKIEKEGTRAKITALGDGEFRLAAFANNGKDHPEVISELEMDISGLGTPFKNPYTFVSGIYLDHCTEKSELCFRGGVFVKGPGEMTLTYDRVDFGEYGSDEIEVPIFIFENETAIEVWEGTPDNGECLGSFTYKAPTLYNHYQSNTFRLKRRIKNVATVSLRFPCVQNLSLKGFSFKKYEKAYSLLSATEYTRISGDSFTLKEDSITSIGNNVSIDFDHMDFSKHGVSKVRIVGRSNNEKTSIHILFTENGKSHKQMIEIPRKIEYDEFVMPLQTQNTNGSISLVFLPGSNFDLKQLQFIPEDY